MKWIREERESDAPFCHTCGETMQSKTDTDGLVDKYKCPTCGEEGEEEDYEPVYYATVCEECRAVIDTAGDEEVTGPSVGCPTCFAEVARQHQQRRLRKRYGTPTPRNIRDYFKGV